MARTPLVRALVDRALGGGLCEFLQARRDAGASYEKIARALHADHDIEVSTETVRTWCRDLIETDAVAPAGSQGASK